MKLSEAIRLGSMMKAQLFGEMFRDGRTCAMGAAFDALGLLPHLFTLEPGGRRDWLNTMTGWGDLLYQKVACPVCGLSDPWLPITHLNDVHCWTRERIADLVELHELQMDLANLHNCNRTDGTHADDCAAVIEV